MKLQVDGKHLEEEVERNIKSIIEKEVGKNYSFNTFANDDAYNYAEVSPLDLSSLKEGEAAVITISLPLLPEERMKEMENRIETAIKRVTKDFEVKAVGSRYEEDNSSGFEIYILRKATMPENCKTFDQFSELLKDKYAGVVEKVEATTSISSGFKPESYVITLNTGADEVNKYVSKVKTDIYRYHNSHYASSLSDPVVEKKGNGYVMRIEVK